MAIKPYALVSEAARPYESRWTLRALLGVDPELYEKFRGQQQDWERALLKGEDVERRGADRGDGAGLGGDLSADGGYGTR